MGVSCHNTWDTLQCKCVYVHWGAVAEFQQLGHSCIFPSEPRPSVSRLHSMSGGPQLPEQLVLQVGLLSPSPVSPGYSVSWLSAELFHTPPFVAAAGKRVIALDFDG